MKSFEGTARRSAERAAQAQKPLTSVCGPAAAIVALQRSIGNRGVTKLVASHSGRRLMRNGWSVPAIDKERDRVKALMAGAWGAEITLHHTISQDRWSRVAADLRRASGQQKDLALRDAASDFWAAVVEAAGPEIIGQTANKKDPIESALDNLPLNLEAGPSTKLVGSNPGTGIDPVSVPGEQGGRVMSPVSAALLKLDDAYRKLRRGEGNPVTHWKEMAAQMRAAKKAHASEQIGHHREMWFESNKKWYRKGTRQLPGLEVGQMRFAEHSSPDKEEIRAHKKSPALVCEKSLIVEVETETGTSRIRIRVPITRGVLHHSCVRHTYRHFNFGDIKAVNNFWPAGYDYSTLEALAPDFATAIAEHFREVVLDTFSGVTRDLWLLHGEEFAAGDLPVGNVEIFVIGSPQWEQGGEEPAQAASEPTEGQASTEQEVEDTWSHRKKARGRNTKAKKPAKAKKKDEKPATKPIAATYTIEMKTLAPDGPLAEAYTVEELRKLAVGVPPDADEELEEADELVGVNE